MGRLCPVDVRLLPNIRREWAEIDDGLAKCLGAILVGRAPWPLFLHGSTGTGKTRAALALCDHVSREAGAAYFTLEELCGLTIGSDQEAKDNAWIAVERKAVFVLDEVGDRRADGELVYSVLRKVLELRERHQNGVALYLSNLNPGMIKNTFDDRIFSRLMCGTKFWLSGKDRRGAK